MDAPRTQPARSCSVAAIDATLVGRWLGVSVLVALAFVAIRRFAGAMRLPLATSAYLLMGIALAAFACWLRKRLEARLGLGAAFGIVGCLVLIGAASFTLAGTPATGLLALWLPIVGESAWSLGQVRSRKSPPIPLAMPERVTEPSAAAIASVSEVATATDPTIVQHLVRRRNVAGAETICGMLRASFAPGERTINLHVPFCPPLSIIPACEAEAVDGPPARVKVTQVLAQGARLEVRLDTVAVSPQQVVIEFTTV